MPRAPRLDLPGLLQHVIVRGIERRKIFRDDTDREAFCERLSGLLQKTGSECLAWALLPNHLHLLLRCHGAPLAVFMRRLLTGYAVTFNLRHHRVGHLFQNRYKSIVCEEEEYLLELVRYIHLNPLRARLVDGVDGLRAFRWGGHAVLMGERSLAGQAIDEVLLRFGREPVQARAAYEGFVAAGIRQGRRDELVGGGLRRSLSRQPREGKRPQNYDARVLGAGEFVEMLRRQEDLRPRLRRPWTLEEVIVRVGSCCGLDADRVRTRSTDPRVVQARGLVCLIGTQELGITGAAVGRVLGMTDSGVSRAVVRVRAAIAQDDELLGRVLGGEATAVK